MTLTLKNRKTKVGVFLEAKDRLNAFREMHQEVFDQLDEILEEYNRALEDAEKEVRSKGESDGPFVVSGQQTSLDVDKLYDWMGHENFLMIGGTISVRQVLGMDMKRFESFVAAGVVPKEVLEECYQVKPRFRAPKKVELP